MTEQDRAGFEAWARSEGAGNSDLEWSPYARRYAKDLTHNYYTAWLAARRTQDEQVRELVEAWNNYKINRCDYDAWHHTRTEGENMAHPLHEAMKKVDTLAAQLKEMTDE